MQLKLCGYLDNSRVESSVAVALKSTTSRLQALLATLARAVTNDLAEAGEGLHPSSLAPLAYTPRPLKRKSPTREDIKEDRGDIVDIGALEEGDRPRLSESTREPTRELR
ncbi:hypothetical protein P280DRAFT_479444 [Massarina eburnea CBS 473.64]|uniref:Uncharacterized protein n=1 Tax=Massarina eburnea CBS 473.64 TaxID=1395130 RepID=A0A6A6S674_9PLEO|nr:hypothetical protein P280DRAFT_479444 [Massarina eburnea CBS 473.64]